MHFTSKLLGALYIAEVSRPSLRGAFGNCLSLSVAVGITFTMVSGALMDWRTLALSCGILPLMGNRSISDIKNIIDIHIPKYYVLHVVGSPVYVGMFLHQM